MVVTLFIDDQTYKSNGKTYRRVLLRNSYRVNGRVKHDTIASLTKCTDEEIDALKWALKNKDKINFQLGSNTSFNSKLGKSVGAVWLLYKMAEKIGIKKALGNSKEAKLCLMMAIASMTGHNSRLSIVRQADRYNFTDILGLDSYNEDDLYKAMDWLSDNQDKIEYRLWKFRRKNAEPVLYLYDVTSSYLEGECNELSAFGYNRDKKKGKKQIVIGFLTDEEGYPISVQVFNGNTSDSTTFKDQIDKVKNRFGCTKVVMVGDRGMIKTAGIKALSEEKYNFITAITKGQIETLLKKEIFQLNLFDEQIVEVQDGDIRYVLKKNPVRASEINANRESKLKSLKNLVNDRNKYLINHKRASVDIAYERVIEKASKLRIDNWLIISKGDRKIEIEINETKRKEVSKLDGCYALKTDLSKKDASKEIIHSRYKDLAKVEWAFRTMKSKFLEMRSIFVRKEKRTRAHVFNVMLGYMLHFNLNSYWKELELTVEEGIEELSHICSLHVSYDGKPEFQTIPEPRDMGKKLLETAQVFLPDVILSRSIKVATRKKLVSERKTHKNP